MILRRLGNKSAIAHKIIPHFPPHKIFVETFFGAGGMFFNKPKAHCNIVNDLDGDVSNLFLCLINRKDELFEYFKIMPKHQDLMEYWIETQETEPIKKAIRFLFLSNYTFLGTGTMLRLSSRDDVECLEKDFKELNNKLYKVQFSNKDFRKFLASISIEEKDEVRTFIYNDGPYIDTNDNYSNSFTEQDSFDLFEANQKTGCKWAMSEFNHPFILDQAKERGLNVITIGERQNLKNRRIEILVTNYENSQLSIFT